jgi:hypothetical protein
VQNITSILSPACFVRADFLPTPISADTVFFGFSYQFCDRSHWNVIGTDHLQRGAHIGHTFETAGLLNERDIDTEKFFMTTDRQIELMQVNTHRRTYDEAFGDEDSSTHSDDFNIHDAEEEEDF